MKPRAATPIFVILGRRAAPSRGPINAIGAELPLHVFTGRRNKSGDDNVWVPCRST
jgi:hypothetical protein